MKRSIYSQNSLLRISLLSALTLTASFTTHAQDKPVAGGVLTVALGSDTPIIDPSITAYSVTALVTRNVVDSLVGQAEDNSFTPWLAERWEIKNNNREYTFHLRKDVTFSDGTKLDAAAVKYNFERILDPKTTSSYSKSLLGPNLNSDTGIFSDLKVRQAFQSAIDRTTAVKAAFFGILKPADNILGPATLDYDPAIASQWGFDLQKARRLLDEAGWQQTDGEGYRVKEGKRLTVQFTYSSNDVEAADVTLFQAIQYQVKQAGFELKLDPVDSGILSSRTAANQYDIISNYFVRPEPDILRTVFHSNYIPPKGNNFSRVKALDSQLETAVGASEAERKRIYYAIQHQIIDQAWAVPIYIPAYQLGKAKQVQGISWATNAKPNFYDVWIQR